jgi:hypothetical protein
MSDSVLTELDELLGQAAVPERSSAVEAAPKTAGPSGTPADPAVLQAMVAVGTAIAVALPPVLAQAQARTAAAPSPPAPGRATGVAGLYARYLGLFVGAGLMAGAVVHFPLAPFRYAVMGVVGAAIFAIGSIGDGFAGRTGQARAIYVGASLALALGVGMVAGGIQHFEDVPARASVLIPVGLLIGLVAFLLRDGHRLAWDQLGRLAVGAVAAAAVVAFGLSTLVPPPGEADAAGGHSHSAAPASTDSHAPVEPVAPAKAVPATPAEPEATPDVAASEPVSRYAAPGGDH